MRTKYICAHRHCQYILLYFTLTLLLVVQQYIKNNS
jgi:hypothetical protein